MVLVLISLFAGFVAGFFFFGAILIICAVIFLNATTQPFSVKPSPSPRSRPNGLGDTREETDSHDDDSVEDSEGDGLMLFNDPMFPPESEEEDP